MDTLSVQQRSRVVFFGAVLTLALVTWLTLFHRIVLDRVWPFDIHIHYRWSVQFVEAISQGHLYPRWMHLANNGMGEPTFLYYAPLYYYAVYVFSLILPNIWDAMNAVSVVATLFAGLATFRFASKHVGAVPALAGASLLILSPTLLFVLTFWGSVTWHAATPFALLFCFRLYELTRNERLFDPALSLALAGLVATHILSAFMLLLCAPLGLLAWAVGANRPWRQVFRTFVRAGASVLLGLAGAAIYLYPALTTWEFLDMSAWSAPGGLQWYNYFAFPVWSWLEYGRPTTLAYVWIIPTAALSLLFVSALYLWRFHSQAGVDWYLTLGLTLIGGISLVLSSELAYPLWEHVSAIRKVNFPVRFTFVGALTGTLAATIALPRLLARSESRVRKLPVVLAVALVGVTQLWLQLELITKAGPSDAALQPQQIGDGLHLYRTAWRGDAWTHYVENGGLIGYCSAQHIRCEVIEDRAMQREWNVSTRSTLDLVLPVFAFPMWQVRVDGAMVPTFVDQSSGLLALALPPGEHQLSLSWMPSAKERIGARVSQAAMAVMILGFLIARRSRRR